MIFLQDKRFLLLLILFGTISNACAKSAITYSFSGGRFGDCLVAYCHARYAAHKNDTPFIYRPFKFSDQLAMHTLHKQSNEARTVRDIVTYPKYPEKGEKVTDLKINKDENLLYVIPFFPECKDERERLKLWHFETDWNDKEFIQILRKEISPVFPLQKLNLPQDKLTLAVHIRRGGGYDKLFQTIKRSAPVNATVNADKVTPLKFPPDSFYIASIKKVSEYFSDQPLYVHIFTDDENPSELVAYYKKKVNKPNITYGCREKDNHYDKNILEDFFALTQFDALIRAQSNYSIIASKLGNYKIAISPAKFTWEDTELVITESYIEIQC